MSHNIMTKAVNIVNLDHPKYNGPPSRSINENTPKHPFRCICVASSNAGKTNWCVNMLLKHLAYDKCHVICPNCDIQPKYLMLKDQMQSIDDAVESKIMKQVRAYNRTHRKQGRMIDSASIHALIDPIMEFHESIPDDLLEQLDPSKQNLVVFDDCLLANKREQELMASIFVRGRHQNCSIITLVQSFYRVPRVLRLQCNWFLLFHSVSEAEVSKLYRECGSNIPRKLFISRIMEATKPKYSYVSIDLDGEKPYKKMNMIDPLFPELN